MSLKVDAQLNTANLQRVCNQTAASYPKASVIAAEIGRRLLNRLDMVRLQPARILDLGCADGRITEQLASRYPEAEVIGIDWAYERLPRPTATSPSSHYVTADMHQLPFAAKSFDLIIINLTLEWSPQWPKLIRDLYQVAKPGALLHFATTGPDTLKELRLAWQLACPLYPHVHPLMDMHHIGDALLKQGFQDPIMDMETLTCLYRSPQQLLSELKANGLQNQLANQRPSLTGKNRLAKMCQLLQDGGDAAGKIPVTVEVVYGHTWKPNTSNSEGSTVKIAVEDIKR